MVQQQDVEDEFDLEKIDTEMRLEKIRQSASKLSWEEFTGCLHRNLKEKKYVLDADGKLDLLQAICYMKKNLPVDENADMHGRLKQLADSLGCSFEFNKGIYKLKSDDIFVELKSENNKLETCKVGYFGLRPQVCVEGCTFLNDGDYNSFRVAVFSMLSLVPSFGNNLELKRNCSKALESLEGFLKLNSGVPSFEAVNTLPYGCFRARNALHAGRIYYCAEPSYMKAADRSNFYEETEFFNLPYLELSIVANEKSTQMPTGPVHDPWTHTVSAPACLCLKFSVPIIFSHGTWQKLEKYLAKPSIAKQHVNIYRHTSRFDFKDENLVLKSCFPEQIVQHQYIISSELLKEESDLVISELFVQDSKNLDKVIALIRSQQMHNSLWESFLSMCIGKWQGGEIVRMKVIPAPTRIEVQYMGNNGMILARFEQNKEFKWSAKVFENNDFQSAAPQVDDRVTEMLLKSHSVPCAMTRVVSSFPSRSTYDPAVATFDASVVIEKMDKVGDAWLPVKRIPPPKPKFVYDVEEDPNPGALLASFKEIEIVEQEPAKPEAMSRTMRLQSDTSYAKANDDMAAIFLIAGGVEDGDMKASTPGVTNRHESSPAPRSAGGITQISPLEAARQRMTHSVGAATAVGLANIPANVTSGDVFEFPDDRSMGVPQFPSPSSQHTNFSYPAITSPITSHPARGGLQGNAKPRRARGRKVGNFGDRTPSTDSIINIGTGNADFPTQPTRRGRGKAPGAGRGTRGRGRKNSALPAATPPEMDQRHMLQRSYSEYTSGMVNQQMYPYQNHMGMDPMMMHMENKPHMPYMEEESDDEHCDPPPPPKNLPMHPSAQYMHTHNQQPMHSPNAQMFHPGQSPLMMSNSPVFQNSSMAGSPGPAGYPDFKASKMMGRRDTTDTPPIPSPLSMNSMPPHSLSHTPTGLNATPPAHMPIPSPLSNSHMNHSQMMHPGSAPNSAGMQSMPPQSYMPPSTNPQQYMSNNPHMNMGPMPSHIPTPTSMMPHQPLSQTPPSSLSMSHVHNPTPPRLSNAHTPVQASTPTSVPTPVSAQNLPPASAPVSTPTTPTPVLNPTPVPIPNPIQTPPKSRVPLPNTHNQVPLPPSVHVSTSLYPAPTSNTITSQTQASTIPPPQVNPPVVPPIRLKNNTRALVSDLYDDGGDSPPPPEERIPAALLGSNTSSNLNSQSFPQQTKDNVQDNSVATSQIKSESKLILKIPKSQRNSTNADSQKAYAREPKTDRENIKRQKVAPVLASPKAVDNIHQMFQFSKINSLKNFKIPKREDNRANTKAAKDAPTATSSSAPTPAVPHSNTNPSSAAPVHPPPAKSVLKKPHLNPPVMNRLSMVGTSPTQRKPSMPMMDHNRRPPLIPGPPSAIPLPKGPPPSRPLPGQWVRPPSSSMANSAPPPSSSQTSSQSSSLYSNLPPPPRSPSPEQPKMQIEDPNSPEDSLRIADD
ncbi:unnamed protein product [Auanema sp. JU1783]|nr:unnamed protein product [Auanema sp. JU1783]